MSFQAMAWAVEKKCANAGQKLVLLMLANHCNGHTGQCNPSHRLLAEECSMGVSTLKGHIAALESAGLLRVVARINDGVSLPNQYVLNLAWVGQNLAGGGSESGRGVGQNLATETGILNQEEKQDGGAVAPTPKTPRKKKEDTTLQDWIDALPEDELAIREDDPLYQDGIPVEMLTLAWAVFKERHADGRKKYADWRAAFRDCVRRDYLKLWAIDREGTYYLTTVGKQAAQRLGV